MRVLVLLLCGAVLAAAGAAWWLSRPAVTQPEPTLAARVVEAPAPRLEPLAEPENDPSRDLALPASEAAGGAAPAAVASASAPEREKRVRTLQHLRQQFEGALEQPGKQRFFVAQNLDVYSIIVLLDAEQRGLRVPPQTRLSLSPSHPGELRIGGGEYLYVFESREFPHYERLLELTGRAGECSEAAASTLEFPPEVQAAVAGRADAALAVLTAGG